MSEQRKRSRSYPGYDLESCVQWAAKIRDELGVGPHDRESLALALGSTGLTGASTRKIGALVHFGLLDRNKGGYTFTSLSDRLARPISNAERRAALVESFLQPELYRQLINRLASEGRVPSRFENILIRSYGIETAAAGDAARIFLNSAKYAGLIDDDGRVVLDLLPEAERFEPEQNVPLPTGAEDEDMPAGHSTSGQLFRFALTGGRAAVLSVPSRLSRLDVALVQKQVELLELQAELSDQAGQ